MDDDFAAAFFRYVIIINYYISKFKRHLCNITCLLWNQCHTSDEFFHIHRSNAGCYIGHCIRQDQFPSVNKGTARVNYIGHISFPFFFIRPSATALPVWQLPFRIMEIEQDSTNGILSHRTDAMRQHQPTIIRLNWWTAVSNLHIFPWRWWFMDDLVIIPGVDVVDDMMRFRSPSWRDNI